MRRLPARLLRDEGPIAPPERANYSEEGSRSLVNATNESHAYLPTDPQMAAGGQGEIMKTRDITMFCAAIVVGTASMAPAPVAAGELQAPVLLAQAAPAPAAPAARTPAATSKAAVTSAPSAPSAVDPVEARIKDLHAQLKITPAQEERWSHVTEVMRENAKAMDALRKARTEKARDMTAVEDFTSYGEMTEVHADGIKKFVPVFSALYDSMSDAQKKNTDVIFRRDPTKKTTAAR